jgi:hypothetical protein
VFETSRFRQLVSEAEVPVPVVNAEAMNRMNLDYFAEIKPDLEKSLDNDRSGQLEKSLQI